MFSTSNARFVGAWKYGKKNGRGVYTSSDQYLRRVEGMWKNDMIHDQHAKVIYANGDRYEGAIEKNKLHGYGKFEYASTVYGRTYEGWYRDGQAIQGTRDRHGWGIYHSKPGERYVGSFSSSKGGVGVKHGHGVQPVILQNPFVD